MCTELQLGIIIPVIKNSQYHCSPIFYSFVHSGHCRSLTVPFSSEGKYLSERPEDNT